MPTVTDTRARPQELLTRMGPEMYHLAYRRGMSLSAYLEMEDPSEGYNDGLDAYERLLRVANIRTQSRPEIGLYADSAASFLDPSVPENIRALFPEWASRMWRRGQVGHSVSARSLHSSADYAPGGTMQPWAMATQPRATRQIAPAIPLSEIIALTTPIDGAAYEAFYITDNASEQRMVRTGEGSEIPRAKLTGGDHTIRLKKYGRVLEATYEFLRRRRLDWLGLHIQRLAAQTESDKLAAIIAILVSGDGNNGTAPTPYNLTTLDSAASAGTLSLKGWIAFKQKFANPYVLTTALVQEAVSLQMMLLNVGSANVPLVAIQGPSGFGSFRHINPGLADSVALGWTSDAPSLKVVAIDNRFAVEQVTEIGASLQEVQRWTTKQTETLTLSEVEGYCMFDPAAVQLLDINA